MYLVIARAAMDDIPLRQFLSIDEARKYAQTIIDDDFEHPDIDHALALIGVDVSLWSATAIIGFQDGRPASVEFLSEDDAPTTHTAADAADRQ